MKIVTKVRQQTKYHNQIKRNKINKKGVIKKPFQ